MIRVYFYLVALERWVPLTIEGSGFPMVLPSRVVAQELAEGGVESGESPAAAIYQAGTLCGFFGSFACEAPNEERSLGFVR